jgi:hypothetical protein
MYNNMKKLFLLGAMACILGMMTGCRTAETAADSNLLLGKWKCVEVAVKWSYNEASYGYECRYEPEREQLMIDTSMATLIEFDFIDTNKGLVTYHTHDCEGEPPFLINVDSIKYTANDTYLSTSGDHYVRPTEYEIEKLTRNTLVLRCFEHDEDFHCQMKYTFTRE